MIRRENRRGRRVLVIDILWRKNDGTRGRYRHDAEVQTMAAATAEERRLLANIALYGDVHEPKREAVEQKAPILFKDAVDTYQKGRAVIALKPSTRIGYDEVFKKKLIPRFGEKPIDRIDLDTMTALDAEMVNEELSVSRRRNVLICLRSVLRDAHRSGRLARLPDFPPLPKKGQKILATLTAEQVAKILAASPPVWRLAFALAAYAGLRAGEVRALRWSDIDTKAHVLVVRRSRSYGVTSTPKSGHERKVPIAEPLAPLLERGGEGLVAITSEGEPWAQSGLLQAFRRAQKKAGLKGWRFHDLRHFFVSTLFRGGGSAPAVQKLAGHLHLSTTQKYAHMVQDDLRATIGILSGLGNSVATAAQPAST